MWSFKTWLSQALWLLIFFGCTEKNNLPTLPEDPALRSKGKVTFYTLESQYTPIKIEIEGIDMGNIESGSDSNFLYCGMPGSLTLELSFGSYSFKATHEFAGGGNYTQGGSVQIYDTTCVSRQIF